MGENTNEHRIGGLEARMTIMEQSHLRLETKIEKRLDDLGTQYGSLDEKFDVLQHILTTQNGAWLAVKLAGAGFIAMAGIAIGALSLLMRS